MTERTLEEIIEERESVIERVYQLQKRLRELKAEIARRRAAPPPGREIATRDHTQGR